jgi:hypothetical protein
MPTLIQKRAPPVKAKKKTAAPAPIPKPPAAQMDSL